MVNTNIQGVIPLNGRGFTAKIKRDFKPGEYNVLSNARLKDDIIQTRFNIRHYGPENQVVEPIANAHPFVGFLDDYVITVSLFEQWAYKPGGFKIAMWDPESLPTDGNATSFHKIVGVFEYNNVWYWLTWRYDHTTVTSSIWAYSVNSTGKTVSTTVFADLTATKLFESTQTGFVYDNFFIYKERLWVCTNQSLYFSESTAPLDFTNITDGVNFFKLRDQNITYAFPHKDNIFILCDSSIHSLNYSANPNTDGYIREVSNVMGADHGTSHNDQAFIVNVDGLYSLSTNSIELVRSDFEVGITTLGSKLVSWDQYLIVIKYSNYNYTGAGTQWPTLFEDVGRVRTQTMWGLSDLVDSNVWFIDMTTGSCHTLDFNDQYSGAGVAVNERGHITDVIVNPNKDLNRSNGLTMMTNKNNGPFYNAHVYLIDNVGDDFFIYDTAVADAAASVIRRMKPNMKIEIHGYTPDGNEYMMKKFRSLELMGNWSNWDFEVLVAYDNQDYVDANAHSLTGDLPGIEAAGTKRSPYPARIGLNQRARSISILLRTKNPRTPMDMSGRTIYERVEITDMRVLWTYTGRGPTHLTQSATT